MKIKAYEVTIKVKSDSGAESIMKLTLMIPEGLTDTQQISAVIQRAVEDEMKRHIQSKSGKQSLLPALLTGSFSASSSAQCSLTSEDKFMWPTTDRQWQDAVDAAHFMLTLEIARLYGLASGGPEVNIELCEQIISQGRTLGFVPSVKVIPQLAEDLASRTIRQPQRLKGVKRA